MSRANTQMAWAVVAAAVEQEVVAGEGGRPGASGGPSIGLLIAYTNGSGGAADPPFLENISIYVGDGAAGGRGGAGGDAGAPPVPVDSEVSWRASCG